MSEAETSSIRGLGRGAWQTRPDEAERAREEVARLGWDYAMRFSHGYKGASILDLLAALDGKDLTYLRASRFLLASETVSLLAVEENLLLTLPKARRVKFDAMQEARGRIDWPATLKERLSRGNDQSWLAIQQADWHAESPERRALAWILDEIAAAWKATARHSAFADIAGKARRLRQNTLLVDVTTPASISARDRQALRQSRSKVFREQVEAAVSVREGLEDDDLAKLRQLLGDRIWLPPEDDKLFEVWVLFILVESLISDGWTVNRMTLMKPGGSSKVAFELKREDVLVELRFQSLAAEVETGSKYGSLLKAYGLGDGDRRPDMCISVRGSLGVRHILVEAKLTMDRGYIAESIYKVFGYLNDYESGLSGSVYPHAVLVVWSGVNSSVADPKHQLEIIDASSVRGGCIAAMISALSSSVTDNAGDTN